MFPFFHWTSKRTQVPVVGSILTGIFTAIVAFVFTLKDLADAISIGTLMAFSLVCAGVMVLRYQKSKFFPISLFLIVAFTLLTFASALSFVLGWPIPLTATLGSISGLLFIILVVVQIVLRNSLVVPTTFACPLVPLVPCLGIAFNMYMLAGLKIEAWLRLFVWLAIGLGIYFFYGIWNSKMRRYNQETSDTYKK